MTITASTPWRSLGDVSLADWERIITDADGDPALASDDCYAAAKGDSLLALAMLGAESSFFTAFNRNVKANNNPLNLRPVNGDGYAVFGAVSGGIDTWHERIRSTTYKNAIYAKTVTIADLVHVYAPSGDSNDETAYVAHIVDFANTHSAEAQEEPPVTYTTTYPGLPGGPLVTTYPVNLDFMLPASQTLNRPGIIAHLPRRSVQHGNGNPNAYAAADAQWLRTGAPGSNGQPQQLSFHCTGDYKGIWGCVPANEVTWQAADGSGPGNYNGFSCEMSEHAAIRGNDTLLDQTISVVADFMGRVSARLTIAIPEQHWNFNAADPDRHDCPNMLRHDTINGRSCWDIYVERWNAAKADELKRMSGGTTVDAEPFAITWEPGAVGVQTIGETKALALLGEVSAKRSVPLRQSVSSTSPVVYTMKASEKAKIVGTYRDPKTSRRWAFIEYADGKYGRCLLSALTPSFPTL